MKNNDYLDGSGGRMHSCQEKIAIFGHIPSLRHTILYALILVRD